MKLFEVSAVIGLVIIAGFAGYVGTHQITVLWKDNGHIANYQQYPVSFANGDGDHLLQRMVIMTMNHGNVTFDTSNMCSRDIALGYSCSQGSVAWGDGMWVFIYHLSNGGNFVGALNP